MSFLLKLISIIKYLPLIFFSYKGGGDPCAPYRGLSSICRPSGRPHLFAFDFDSHVGSNTPFIFQFFEENMNYKNCCGSIKKLRG